MMVLCWLLPRIRCVQNWMPRSRKQYGCMASFQSLIVKSARLLHPKVDSNQGLNYQTAALTHVVLHRPHVGHTVVATCANGTLIFVFEWAWGREDPVFPWLLQIRYSTLTGFWYAVSTTPVSGAFVLFSCDGHKFTSSSYLSIAVYISLVQSSGYFITPHLYER